MGRKPNKKKGTPRLQSITLCISTAMVLVLLGLVVLSVLSAHKLSKYFREHLVVTVMLDDDMSETEALQFCGRLEQLPAVNALTYISKEQALKEGTEALGTDPTEFTEGVNPFPSLVELTMKANYANNDSLEVVAKQLKTYPKVSEVRYQQDLIDQINRNLAKVSVVLLILAALLTFVSFALINNTVRLGIYARRFNIHTMKLVGASWSFIRKPFLRQAVYIGVVASVMAWMVLGTFVYVWSTHQPELTTIVTGRVMAVTFVVVAFFGIAITTICSGISVNKFLWMKAGELYKI